MKSVVIKLAVTKRPAVERFINSKVKKDLIVTSQKHDNGIQIISGFDSHLEKAVKMVNEFVKVLDESKTKV